MRRGDLPLGVARHRRWDHAQGLPGPRQRHHHREQRRLHHLDPVQPRRPRLTGHHIQHRPIHPPLQRRRTLTHRRREHRAPGHQPRRHPRPLRPLTPAHKHHTPGTPPTAAPRTTPSAASPAATAASPAAIAPASPASTTARSVQAGPARRQRIPHIHQPRAASPGAGERFQPPRLRPQPGRAPPRHHPRHHPARHQPA